MEFRSKFNGFFAVRGVVKADMINPISLFSLVYESVFNREKSKAGVWAMVT